MPKILKKVEISVEIRVQWEGAPDSFYAAKNKEGHPGIAIPLALAAVASRLEDATIFVDRDKPFPESCRTQLKKLFEGSVALGPKTGNEQLALYSTPLPTNLQPEKWKPGTEALAWQAGTRELDPEGKPVPGTKTKALVVEYPSGLRGLFWMSFRLRKKGW